MLVQIEEMIKKERQEALEIFLPGIVLTLAQINSYTILFKSDRKKQMHTKIAELLSGGVFTYMDGWNC